MVLTQRSAVKRQAPHTTADVWRAARSDAGMCSAQARRARHSRSRRALSRRRGAPYVAHDVNRREWLGRGVMPFGHCCLSGRRAPCEAEMRSHTQVRGLQRASGRATRCLHCEQECVLIGRRGQWPSPRQRLADRACGLSGRNCRPPLVTPPAAFTLARRFHTRALLPRSDLRPTPRRHRGIRAHAALQRGASSASGGALQASAARRTS